MAYSVLWGTKSPGHLLFLLDQSGSMAGKNEQKVADAVHAAILELINNCISGTKVKERVFITIIGYGNQEDVSIIKEGWASDYARDLQKCKENGTRIIAPESFGGTPMELGFQKAAECITKWLNDRQNAGGEIPAPIVINITDGMPNSTETATSEAKKLMNMSTPDGNVILFNIHMDEFSNHEIQFPSTPAEAGDSMEAHFLYDISSEMTEQFVRVAKSKGFEGVCKGAKGFVANANGDTLVRFIEFGSSVSTFNITPR